MNRAPDFDRVPDGYDPAQVDAYLKSVGASTPAPAPARPANAARPAAHHPAARAQARRVSAERGRTADEATVGALRAYLAQREEQPHVFADEVEEALVRVTEDRTR